MAFKALRCRLKLDFFSTMRLINYVRTEKPTAKEVMAMTTAEAWADEKYLKPAIEDDPLLMMDMEDEDQQEETLSSDLDALNLALQEKEAALSDATETLAKMRETLKRTLDEPADDVNRGQGVAAHRKEDEDQVNNT